MAERLSNVEVLPQHQVVAAKLLTMTNAVATHLKDPLVVDQACASLSEALEMEALWRREQSNILVKCRGD